MVSGSPTVTGGLMVVEIPVKTDRLNRARLSRGYGSTGLAARNLFLPHIFNKDRDIPMLKIAMEIIPSKKVPGALYSRARIFPECPKGDRRAFRCWVASDSVAMGSPVNQG